MKAMWDCLRILHHREQIQRNIYIHSKLWGKTLFEGKLRSQKWWQNRFDMLMSEYIKTLPVALTLFTEKEMVDWPTPYEVEFNMSNKTDCTDYFSWLERKKSFDKI